MLPPLEIISSFSTRIGTPKLQQLNSFGGRPMGFRARLRRNLYQELDGVDFPFPFLEPRALLGIRGIWWEKKLRKIVTVLAEEKHEGSYFRALRELSRRLVHSNWLAYHSVIFSGADFDLPLIFGSENLTSERARASYYSKRLRNRMVRGTTSTEED